MNYYKQCKKKINQKDQKLKKKLMIKNFQKTVKNGL